MIVTRVAGADDRAALQLAGKRRGHQIAAGRRLLGPVAALGQLESVDVEQADLLPS